MDYFSEGLTYVTESAAERELIAFQSYFLVWSIPCLILIAVSGTSLCLIVMIKRNTGPPETRNFFMALSISDLWAVVFGLGCFYLGNVDNIFSPSSAIFVDPRRRNATSCYLLSIAVYFGLLVSSWLQAAISILRVIANQYPVQIKHYFDKTNSRRILIFIIIFCFSLTTIMIGSSMEYIQDVHLSLFPPDPSMDQHEMFHNLMNVSSQWGPSCSLKSTHTSMFFTTSLLIKVLLPTLCLSVSSIVICFNVRRGYYNFRRNSCATFPQNSSNANIPSVAVSTEGDKHGQPQKGASSSQSRRQSSSRRQMNLAMQHVRLSRCLLGMNLTFLACTLPFEIFKLIFHSQDPRDLLYDADSMDAWLRLRILEKSLNLLIYMNHASNWLFYFMLGGQFRKHVRDFICRRRGQQRVNCFFFVKSREVNDSNPSNASPDQPQSPELFQPTSIRFSFSQPRRPSLRSTNRYANTAAMRRVARGSVPYYVAAARRKSSFEFVQ